MESLTETPSLMCTNFDTALSIDNNNSSISNTETFFCCADEIEITRSIQDVDLNFIKFDWNYRRADRKLSFLLFFIKITDGVAVSNIAGSSIL